MSLPAWKQCKFAKQMQANECKLKALEINENQWEPINICRFFRLKPTCADPTNVGKARRWLFLLSARHLYTQLFTQLWASKLEAARGLVFQNDPSKNGQKYWYLQCFVTRSYFRGKITPQHVSLHDHGRQALIATSRPDGLLYTKS